MAKTITIDPVTRIEGHMKVHVTLDSSNIVTSAKSSGNLFRGFEKILINRPPNDAALITQRICGVCPVSHAIASSRAVESAAGFTPKLQAVLLRNIIQASNFIASHILHFYHLTIMDYITGPEMSPWASTFTRDLRFSDTDTQSLINNYIEALTIRRKAQELGALFCGKLPHAANIVPGGVTVTPTASDIQTAKTLLQDVKAFVDTKYQNDVDLLAKTYSDYFYSGKGYGSLLCSGSFIQNTSGNPVWPSGVVKDGMIAEFNQGKIGEFVKYSLYSSPSGRHPNMGVTTPNPEKANGYSWIKATRYENTPYEVGPLARMTVGGSYKRGISVMDRHLARRLETSRLVQLAGDWLSQLTPNASAFAPVYVAQGAGYGIIEASRGMLGHWVGIKNAKITRYQIITPTCWNGSPMDDKGQSGPMEKAMVGTYVENPDQPVELLRIVHSFDPCTACAVHVISPQGEEMSRFVVPV